MQLNAHAGFGRLADEVRSFFAPEPPAALGVAVSGGGDSVALLCLLADWSAEGGPSVQAVTVDHGLRVEAADEAAGVARLASSLGIPHATLRWEDRDGPGNLSDRARTARYRLISGWATAQGLGVVALGHTLDDQAETVLMRLQRGSGVDGLSGMRSEREVDGVRYVRPMLRVRRSELRRFLRLRRLTWVDDPTNEDDAYLRARVRKSLEVLDPLGLGPGTLADTATRLAMASDALRWLAQDVARRAVSEVAGSLVLAADVVDAAPRETRLRLFASALQWVGGGAYRPRFDSLSGTLDGLTEASRTLAGCVVWRDGNALWIAREAVAVGSEVAVGDVWDGRWRVTGPETAGLLVRALGPQGLALCPGAARETGLPREVLLSSPAVWKGSDLVAAPVARPGKEWRAETVKNLESFVAGLMVS